MDSHRIIHAVGCRAHEHRFRLVLMTVCGHGSGKTYGLRHIPFASSGRKSFQGDWYPEAKTQTERNTLAAQLRTDWYIAVCESGMSHKPIHHVHFVTLQSKPEKPGPPRAITSASDATPSQDGNAKGGTSHSRAAALTRSRFRSRSCHGDQKIFFRQMWRRETFSALMQIGS
jgi:hypothetical protein